MTRPYNLHNDGYTNTFVHIIINTDNIKECIKCQVLGYRITQDCTERFTREYLLEEVGILDRRFWRTAEELFLTKEQKEEDSRNMRNLTEIVCPECGSKLEVYWYADAGTSVIACNNEECKFKTEICNKEINSAFYMQYYNKMKYKEDLQKEIELRHG